MMTVRSLTQKLLSKEFRSAKLLVAALLALVWGMAALPAAEPAAPSSAPAGLDLAGMDTTVAPGDDFFSYANGTWLKNTPIPDDRRGYGVGSIVQERTQQRTIDLIKQAASGSTQPGSEERKISDFYAGYLDEALIESKGLQPIRPTLATIAGLADRTGLARYLGSELRADVDILNSTNLTTNNIFGLWVAQDLDNPNRYVPFLLQGGLGMPDREYYLDPSPRMTEIRVKYREYLVAMLRLAEVAEPETAAERVFQLEKRMAEVHWNREDTGDIQKGNNHWTRKDFSTKAPGLDWTAFFAVAGLGRQQDFVVWQPSALTGLAALAGAEPLATWKEYLAVRALERYATVLPKALRQVWFAFHGTALTGVPKPRDRWKSAVDATSVVLGEAVGKLYVGKYFPPSEKDRAQRMVRNIIEAFRSRIDRLDWMAPATKAKAKAKLDTLLVGVGYPDRWIDYRNLRIERNDPFGNLERAGLFELRRSLAKLGRPVDRHEWVMTPQEVNAVNLPALNAMNFPAAILQPPFFDPQRPEVMDYGCIGSIIGHEISHSFDDSGSLFDERGKLSNWWTDADRKHFQAASALLVRQYDAYRPFPDAAVNGKLTLGENIADVAGLTAAYDAYQLSLGGRPAPTVQGLTGDQLFFLSFTQGWRSKSREQALRLQLLTDAHSPAEYRGDAVRNLDAWYAAFDVKPGQKLYLAPAERGKVW